MQIIIDQNNRPRLWFNSFESLETSKIKISNELKQGKYDGYDPYDVNRLWVHFKTYCEDSENWSKHNK